MEKIIWLAIMLLPYDSFGLIGGHLRPISTPILFCVFCVFLINRNHLIAQSNVYDVRFYKTILMFLTASVIGFIKSLFEEFTYNPDGETPMIRLLQTFVFLSITLFSYVSGKMAAAVYEPTRMILLTLHSFIIPIIFGLLQIITGNNFVVLKISSFISSGLYPEGYNRIWMLFSEPNIAGLYLSCVVMPIILLSRFKNKNVKTFLAAIVAIEIYWTRSLTGYFLFAIFILRFIVRGFKSPDSLASLTILFSTIFISSGVLFFGDGADIFDNRMFKISSAIFGGGFDALESGEVEGSAASRYISHWAAIRLALDHPLFGVGFRQFGFYYPSLVPDAYFFSQDFKTILFGADSFRLTDVKSFHLDILSSTGIFVMLYFLYWQLSVFKKISRIGPQNGSTVKIFGTIFVLLHLGGLVAIPMIGFPLFWFLNGYVSNVQNFTGDKIATTILPEKSRPF